MGELYAGDFGTGRYSLGAEAALWLTYISFQQYGSWIQADSRAYAVSHAGVAMGGKDDQFFVNVSNFQDVYTYNEKKLQDRNLAEVYDPAQGYYWKWDNDVDRQRFRSLRISSAKVFDNSRFVIGAVVVNHIISAISAARLARQVGRTVQVLVDRLEGQVAIARGPGDAPDIDGVVRVRNAKGLKAGEFARVRIDGADAYDLTGVPASQ